MAKVKKNMLVNGLGGSLGKDHYARITRDGRTIISTKPDFSNRQFSEAQLHVQGGMKQAAAYAKVASKTNPIYAQKALGKSKNAYNIALGDWFNPPVVNYIDWDQGHIRVQASNDVMVTKVTITMLNELGKCLEQGDAELKLGVWWEYQTAQSGLIRVEAWDLAGNVTRQEFTPSRFYSVWERTRKK
jgi:hypothetical protein